MRRTRTLGGLLLAAVLSLSVRSAQAQLVASLADDLILLTSKLRPKEGAQTHQHLGSGPATLQNLFPVIPGAPRPSPSEPTSSQTPGPARFAPPPTLAPAPTPLYGPLEIPATVDEGPPGGVTLDQAIERLIEANPDLRTRFQELSKAQADILTAGLRNNPFLFGAVGNVPYGSYSPQRPGGLNYEVTIIQAWDVNQKRKSRIQVAQCAKNVLDFLYQDAVRLQIDNLYTVFLDVLAARQALLQQEIGLAGLNEVVKQTQLLVKSNRDPTDLMRAEVQRNMASRGVAQAKIDYSKAKRQLGVLLNLSPAQMDCLELRGSLAGFDVELPPLEQLIQTALLARPDLSSYRLGVQRAQAEVQMARADRFADVFLLYTPWQLQDNSAINAQNATSWSFSALVTLPIFNRNQGNIARSQYTVNQTLIELEGQERKIVAEVQQAYAEYMNNRDAVKDYHSNILPPARRFRDEKWKKYNTGTANYLTYLEAQKEYNDVVRSYLETLIRHRRGALHLNTVLAQRIVP